MTALDALGERPGAEAAREEVRAAAAAQGLRLVSIEITHEPMPDPAIVALEASERERIDSVSRRIYEDAAALVPELEVLVARHPHIPMLRNHLANALDAAGEFERGRAVIAEVVRAHPRYVFGFANHVMALLATRRVEEARGLLETGPRGSLMHVSLFDPSRTLFHATEVIAYSAMVGHYLISTGRIDGARTYLEMCRGVDAGHAMTLRLRKRLREVEAIADAFVKALGPRRARGGGGTTWGRAEKSRPNKKGRK